MSERDTPVAHFSSVRQVLLTLQDSLPRPKRYVTLNLYPQARALTGWRLEVWNKTGGKCWYCGEQTRRGYPIQNDPLAFSVDHFIPRSKGGPHTFENLVPCCMACNLQKNKFDVRSFEERALATGRIRHCFWYQRIPGLYPRHESLDECFEALEDTDLRRWVSQFEPPPDEGGRP